MKQRFLTLLLTLLVINSKTIQGSNKNNVADTTDKELIDLLMFENSEMFQEFGWKNFLWGKHQPTNWCRKYWIQTSLNPHKRADHNPEQRYELFVWKAISKERLNQTRFQTK